MHLKYDEIPPPCRGDVVITDFAMEQGLDKENLMSMSRTKGQLNVMFLVLFLSDIVTAGGKHLEGFL